MSVTVVVGGMWGDEGKGKVVDILSPQFDLCARYNGGSNAGHTIKVNNNTFAFHLCPSGILHPKSEAVIGNGTVVHFPTLLAEIDMLTKAQIPHPEKRIHVSDRCHVVLDLHMKVDGAIEGIKEQSGQQLGTTKKGIGPCYADKAARTGVRACDLLRFDECFVPKARTLAETYNRRFPDLHYDIEAEIAKFREMLPRIVPMIADTIDQVHTALREGKTILAEGANALFLDTDYGTYPYVTSSHPCTGGCCTGLAVPPSRITRVIGVVKAYTTRVGEGPFPTELLPSHPVGHTLQTVGKEFGTTTGRVRRCGWLDMVLLRYSSQINGFTEINLTKIDVLTGITPLRVAVDYVHNGKTLRSFPASLKDLAEVEVVWKEYPGWTEDISKCRKMEDLPKNCRDYILAIQNDLGVPVKSVGVGADRDDMIML